MIGDPRTPQEHLEVAARLLSEAGRYSGSAERPNSRTRLATAHIYYAEISARLNAIPSTPPAAPIDPRTNEPPPVSGATTPEGGGLRVNTSALLAEFLDLATQARACTTDPARQLELFQAAVDAAERLHLELRMGCPLPEDWRTRYINGVRYPRD